MTQLLIRRAMYVVAGLGLLALAASACNRHKTTFEYSIEAMGLLFQQLKPNLSQPIIARVQKMPNALLKSTMEFDLSIGIENAKNYVSHQPSVAERALFQNYIEKLPKAHQDIFKKKLLAVYLVDGFSGAGLTDWVVDQESKTYYYLVLNTALFSTSIDEWLSFKEDSAFDKSRNFPVVKVRTNTVFKALMYGLLHEGPHMVDYEMGVTPYLDAQHRKLTGRTQENSRFTDGVWLTGTEPVAANNFKHRAELNIYAIFSSKQLIPRAELNMMFLQLKETPFVSFYSGSSWNEDLADYVTYYHLERILGGAVTLQLQDSNGLLSQYAPVKTKAFKLRESAIQLFYD